MHSHTIRTKFTFGDRVRFDSTSQRLKGTGTVYIITFDGSGHYDYMIEIDGQTNIQGGILEEEITLLEAEDK